MASNLNKTNVGGFKTSSRSLNNLLASADKQFAEAINLLSGDRGELDIRTVGLRTFRRGGTTDAKDCFVHPTAVDVHCRWRDRGVSTQDIYDARSVKRRVRVSAAMLAPTTA